MECDFYRNRYVLETKKLKAPKELSGDPVRIIK